MPSSDRAKFAVPPPPPWRVGRPALVGRMEEAVRGGASLVLVSAPAGYGKTSLLADWARLRAPRSAWLSLDAADDDPARLASDLAAALGGGDGPGADRGAAVAAGAGAATEPVALAVDRLAGAAPFLFALDDVHLLRSAGSLAMLQSLAERLPEGAVLALAARSEPRLRLARLRAAGRLLELGEPDLRFGAAETAALAGAAGAPGLSREEAALLEARTEGWAAGIVLAARSLAARAGSGGRGAALALLRDARAAHRWALDYLLEEVLDAAPVPVASFLLSTCVLERISRPLAEAVAGAPVPGGSLEALAREALFLAPLDAGGGWWRYHQLFAELLLGRLREERPGEEPLLRARAAAWLESAGFCDEAASQYLAAGDAEAAARLLEAASEGLAARGELAALLARIGELPAAVVAARPALLSAKAFALFFKGGSLRDIEAAVAPVGGPLAELFGSFSELYRGRADRAGSVAERLAGREGEGLGAMGRFFAGMIAAYARGEAGRPDEALALADAAAREGGLIARCAVAAYAGNETLRRGDLGRAKAFLQTALAEVAPAGAPPPPVAGRILALLGEIELFRGDFAAAEDSLARSVALLERMGEASAFAPILSLARLRSACGEDASLLLERARRIARDFDATDLDDRGVAWATARDAVLRGDPSAARRAVESLPPPPSGPEASAFYARHTGKYESVEKARLLLAEGRPEAALAVLDPLPVLFESCRRGLYLTEILLLSALAEEARGRAAEAERSLAAALARAAPELVRLPFVEGGSRARAAIARLAERLPEPSRSFALVLAGDWTGPGSGPGAGAAAGDESPQRGGVAGLRPREAEILAYLPSALSAAEIGERLFLSENTVKTHLKSLYAKLGAHSRSDAIAKAQGRGLLPSPGAARAG